jgi:T5SS/PEP-CTERM-associated repeat protein
VLNSTNVWLGYRPGSSGTATVEGLGSTWTNGQNIIGQNMVVGYYGDGTLNIRSGGSVNNVTGTDTYLGYQAGSNGTVSVDGNGSALSVKTLYIGSWGNGSLHVKNGAHLNSAVTRLGYQPGTTGVMVVDGAGSVWTDSQGLQVGFGGGGSGQLTISGGAQLTSLGAELGSNAGSSITVTGTGSSWSSTSSISDVQIGRVGLGTLNVSDGAVVDIRSNVILGYFSTGNGVVNLSDGKLSLHSKKLSIKDGTGTFNFTGGRLEGAGTIDLKGPIVQTGGTLAPGTITSTTSITGDYTQQSAAALEIQIAGITASTQYDVVNVTGVVSLYGQLQVVMTNDFVANSASSFAVLTATTTITGAFANVANGQRLATTDGIGSFLVNYGSTSSLNPKQVILTNFELSGDFNGDRSVNAADYVTWRKSDGTQLGYDTWRSNFSNPGSFNGSMLDAQVPEPASALLLISGAAMVIWRGRRLPFRVSSTR